MPLILSHPPPSLRRSSRISLRRQSSAPSIPNRRPPLRLVLPSDPSPSPSRSTSSRPRSRSRSRLAQKPASPVRAGVKRKRPATDPNVHADQCDLPRYELVLPSRSLSPSSQTPRQLRYAKRQRHLSPPLSPSPDPPRPPLPAVDLPPHTEISSHRPHDVCSSSPPPEPQHVAEHSLSASSSLDALSTEEDLSEYDDDAGPDAPIFTPLSRRPVSWRNRTPDSTDPVLWKTLCQERVEHLKTVYRDVFRAVIQAEADTYPTVFPEGTNAAGAAPATPVLFEHYTPSQYVDADGDSTMSEPVAPQASEGEADMDGIEDDEDDEDEDDSELSESDADTPPPEYEHVMILEAPPPAPPAQSTPVALVAPHTTTPAHRHRLPRLSSIRVYGLEPFPPSSRNGIPFIGRGTPADRQRLADWAAPPLPLYVAPRPSLSPHASLSPEPMTWGSSMAGVDASSSPEPMFFTEDMIPQPPQPQASSSCQGMTADFALNGMTWLDPTLRAESLSPSPSPSPAPSGFPSNSPSGSSLISQTFPSFPCPLSASTFPGENMSSFTITHPHSTLSLNCSGMAGMQLGALTASPSPSPTGTGCALHESFLECLQAPGCACVAMAMVAGPGAPFSFFSSPPQSVAFVGTGDAAGPMGAAGVSGGADAGVGAAIGMGSMGTSITMGMMGMGASTGTGGGAGGGIAAVFPNQELAQFVRAHLVPAGSVTLSHALG